MKIESENFYINLNEYEPEMPLSLPFTVLVGRALYLVVIDTDGNLVCIHLEAGVICNEFKSKTIGGLFLKFNNLTNNWRIIKSEINLLQYGTRIDGISYNSKYPNNYPKNWKP